MSKTIDFGKTVKIVTRAAITKTINIPEEAINVTGIIVEKMIDTPGVSVYADILFSTEDTELKHVLLWEGEDYANIGQWTDENVAAKLIEIYVTPVSNA